MSSINSQTVRKIASLSRLKSDPDEQFLSKYSSQLTNVLDYLETLQEVDVTGVSATAVIAKITLDDLQEDQIDPDQDNYQITRTNIIANFPQRQGDLLVIPVRIIE
jgi:aspartyl-tRNA(Asn)/glutamyl-tRNA(Gln) amidotransferase subunit C